MLLADPPRSPSKWRITSLLNMKRSGGPRDPVVSLTGSAQTKERVNRLGNNSKRLEIGCSPHPLRLGSRMKGKKMSPSPRTTMPRNRRYRRKDEAGNQAGPSQPPSRYEADENYNSDKPRDRVTWMTMMKIFSFPKH